MSPSSSNWHCDNCPQLRIVMSSSDQQDLIDYLDSKSVTMRGSTGHNFAHFCCRYSIPYELTLFCGLSSCS